MSVTTPSAVEPALEEALRAAVREARGSAVHDVAIRSIRREPYAYGSTHALDSIELTLDDGSTLWLLAKTHVAGTGPGRDARDPHRELAVYTNYLARSGTGAPSLYGVLHGPRRVTLFLERIDGVELYQIGQPAAWLATARWLAAFHRRFRRQPGPVDTRLLVRDAAYWQTRWDRAVEAVGSRSGADAGRLRGLEPAFHDAVRHLAGRPRTLIHGELYPANILIQRAGDTVQVRPVDWEMAGHGPAVLDLAALTAGRWGRDERRAMISAYRGASRAGDEVDPGLESDRAFERALRAARLLLAVQWLGWADGWSPPPEQANDWLAEALGAAEEAD